MNCHYGRCDSTGPTEFHEVFEADGWTCQLCGQAIDRLAIAPHPRSVNLDTVFALPARRENSLALSLADELNRLVTGCLQLHHCLDGLVF